MNSFYVKINLGYFLIIGIIIGYSLAATRFRPHPKEPIPPPGANTIAPVDYVCLNCICEFGCGITKPYWADAGKPFVPGDELTNPKIFDNCMKDLECLTGTVQGYMARFQQDCNGDGKIDCEDFAKIHMLGGYDCNDTVPLYYQRQVKLCLDRHKLASSAG